MSWCRIRILICLLLLHTPALRAQTGLWKLSRLPVPPGSPFSLINFADSASGWVFSAGGHYSLTSDGGITWSPVQSLPDSLQVAQARLYDAGTGLLLAGVSHIYSRASWYLVLTTDRGATWSLSGLPVNVFQPYSVSIASRHLIGCLSDSGAILRSTDLGLTWDTLTRPRIIGVGIGGGLAIMKNGRIFVWSVIAGMLGDGLLVTSADSGKTWNPLSSRIDMSSSWGTVYNDDIASFDLIFGDPGDGVVSERLLCYNASSDSMVRFSGNSNHFLGPGVFYDDGTSFVIPSWLAVLTRKSSTPDDTTYVIRSDTLGERVFRLATVSPKFSWILSDSNLVFRRTDLLTGIDRPDAHVHEFRLFQNYPNPFNPTTTIRYTLSRRSQVRLTIANILGQQVALLVDAVVEAGNHEVRLDGSNLASGVYFYRLKAGSFVGLRKMLLIH